MATSTIKTFRISNYELKWLDYSAKQLGLSRTELINKAWKEFVKAQGITLDEVPGVAVKKD